MKVIQRSPAMAPTQARSRGVIQGKHRTCQRQASLPLNAAELTHIADLDGSLSSCSRTTTRSAQDLTTWCSNPSRNTSSDTSLSTSMHHCWRRHTTASVTAPQVPMAPGRRHTWTTPPQAAPCLTSRRTCRSTCCPTMPTHTRRQQVRCQELTAQQHMCSWLR